MSRMFFWFLKRVSASMKARGLAVLTREARPKRPNQEKGTS